MSLVSDVLVHPAVPIGFAVIFLGVTAMRSVLAGYQNGKSPFVIDRSDPVLGFVGAVFGVVVVGLMAYFGSIVVAPDVETMAGHVPRTNEEGWRLASGVVMTASLAWMTVAQFAMGRSWRVGIDQSETLELQTSGPFAVSRNPIFTGMLGLTVGLALWSPTAVTLAALATAYVALEVQIRAEEIYLERTIGEPYRHYRARTPRWL